MSWGRAIGRAAVALISIAVISIATAGYIISQQGSSGVAGTSTSTPAKTLPSSVVQSTASASSTTLTEAANAIGPQPPPGSVLVATVVLHGINATMTVYMTAHPRAGETVRLYGYRVGERALSSFFLTITNSTGTVFFAEQIGPPT